MSVQQFHPRLTTHLESLTQALDNPGTDLEAVLSVLVDDLTRTYPSFLGLEVALQLDGQAVAVTSFDSSAAGLVRASLQLPLSAIAAGDTGGSVVFYAAAPGAFADLAADTRQAYRMDGQVVLDEHLSPQHAESGVTGLAELSAVNQAIGILVARGRTVEEARAEL